MDAEARMRQQRGLITRSQAQACGLTRGQIAHRLRTGRWERAGRGVYRHRAAPRTWHQDVLAAVLATGGLASHGTAIALFGLDAAPASPVTVTVAHDRHQRVHHGAVVHATTQWAARQADIRQGIPCTGIERSLLDVAFDLDVDTLERLAEEAVRRRLTTFQTLARFLVLHGRCGRPGSAGMRAMLMRRDPNAELPLSDFSRLVHRLIVDLGLPEPVLEYAVTDASGRFILQADLAWPDERKIVELDGLAFHFGRPDIERDRRKRARARADGWRIMEVLWSMYQGERHDLGDLLTRFLTD